jgi:WD40 repeat protein
VDLRWGVSSEAAKEHQTMKICLNEIARCQEVSPHPNFIALLGNRYGWRPLPIEIQAKEFHQIEHHLKENEKNKRGLTLLYRYYGYRADENAIPPVFTLKKSANRTDEPEMLKQKETEFSKLSKILRRTVKELGFKPNQQFLYTSSATEKEITSGVFKAKEPNKAALCFIRNIAGLNWDISENSPLSHLIDLDDGKVDEVAQHRLEDLKNRIRRQIPDNVFEYSAKTNGNGLTTDHINWLCKCVYKHLKEIIHTELSKTKARNPLVAENVAHDKFSRDLQKHFIGRTQALSTILNYLSIPDNRPMFVCGQAGAGKTTLMAQVVKKADELFPKPELISRFIGVTPESSDIRSLLESLCRNICRLYGENESTVPTEYDKLVQDFPKMLAFCTEQKPLFIILDALDQLSIVHDGHKLDWLPRTLPVNARLVASVSSEILPATFKNRIRMPHFLSLKPMPREEAGLLLDLWLNDIKRRLSPNQKDLVLAAFETTGLPLYLRLSFEEARSWRSDDKPKPLMPDIDSIIRRFFERLSDDTNHGELMVSRSLAYLAASKYGLSHEEIQEILSSDMELKKDFKIRSPDSPPIYDLPDIVWSRLFFDLVPYMTERSADGAVVLDFYHPKFREVVEDEYMGEDAGKERHRALAHFFSEQDNQEAGPKKIPNLRKLSEWPYQLAYGEMWTELDQALTSYSFLRTKTNAIGPQPVIDDFDLAVTSSRARLMEKAIGSLEHLKAIQSSLRSASHILSSDPKQLPSQLAGRLHGCDLPQVQRVLHDIKCNTDGSWLFPQTASLMPAKAPLLRTIAPLAHIGSAVTVTAEEHRVLCGCWDGTLSLWDLKTGIEIRRFEGHTNKITALAVTPGGRQAISTSLDHTARLWNLSTGEELRCLEAGRLVNFLSLALLPDGRRVLTGSVEGVLSLWDLETGTKIRDYGGWNGVLTYILRRVGFGYGHLESVNSVAVTANGRIAISCSNDKTLRLWDLEAGKEIRRLEGHKRGITAIMVMPNGRRALSDSYDGTLRLWDLETGQQIRCIERPTGSVYAVSITNDGCRALSYGGLDHTLRFWEIETGKEIRCLWGHTGAVRAATVLADGKRAVSTADDRTLRLWDMQEEMSHFVGHKANISAVAVTPDGRRAVSGSNDKTIRLWDLRTGKEIRCLEGHKHGITTIMVMPNGRQALSGSSDKTMRLWDLETGVETRRYVCKEDMLFRFRKWIDIKLGRTGSNLYEWIKMESQRIDHADIPFNSFRSFIMHTDAFELMALTPNGRQALSCGSFEKTLRLWDLNTGKEIRRLYGHTKGITALTIAPDGRQVISGSWDGTLHQWDLHTGMLIRRLEDFENIPRAISVLPDCRRAMSVNYDNTLSLWELSTRNEIRRFVGHKGKISTIAVLADGRRALSGADDNTIRLWDLESGETIATFSGDAPITCIAATRNNLFVAGSVNGVLYILQLKN